MLKKTITYDNLFTEQQVTEEHYFHISKADLVEMEVTEHQQEYTSSTGEKLTGMQAKLQRIVDSKDGKAIMAEFKDIIRRSYGKKDGDRFLKSPEIWADFSSSEAFSQLLWELCTDASAAAEFINGIVPGNLDQIAAEVREKAAEITAEQATGGSQQSAAVAAVERVGEELGADMSELKRDVEPRVLTLSEAQELDQDELKSGLATGRYKLS